jgi:hypothetical protein
LEVTSTFDLLLEHLARAVDPLNAAVTSPERAEALVNVLGWELPAGAAELSAIASKVGDVVDKLDVVVASTPEEQEDESIMLGRYADLLLAVGALLKDLPARAQALATTQLLPSDYRTKTQIEQRLPTRLLDQLVISYTEQEAPLIFAVLLAAGIFEVERVDAEPSLYQTEHVRRTVQLDRLGALFSDNRSMLGEGCCCRRSGQRWHRTQRRARSRRRCSGAPSLRRSLTHCPSSWSAWCAGWDRIRWTPGSAWFRCAPAPPATTRDSP